MVFVHDYDHDLSPSPQQEPISNMESGPQCTNSLLRVFRYLHYSQMTEVKVQQTLILEIQHTISDLK